jgi:hypothetical protein
MNPTKKPQQNTTKTKKNLETFIGRLKNTTYSCKSLNYSTHENQMGKGGSLNTRSVHKNSNMNLAYGQENMVAKKSRAPKSSRRTW